MKLTLSLEQKVHLGRIAAKQFLLITDQWRITDNQRRILAGAATRTTISTWRKKVKSLDDLQLGNDTYERLTCIYDINELLINTRFESPHYKNLIENDFTAKTIRENNDYFDNESLLDVMLKGWVINLYQVKDYLNITYNQGCEPMKTNHVNHHSPSI